MVTTNSASTTPDRAIFCTLNQLLLVKDEFGNEHLPEERSYGWFNKKLGKRDPEDVLGIHANEAPVKALLKRAHESGKDVTEINYLCSNKCAARIIPVALAAHIPSFTTFKGNFFSSEDFFQNRIEAYCIEKGYQVPSFTGMAYTPRWPTDSLGEINVFLGEGYEIGIDITGGRRDAVILEVLSIQLLKLKSSDSALKALVYASYDDSFIIDQKPTFDLISLVDAIGAFINYGKVDKLYDFFITNRDNWNHVSPEIRFLLERMRAFSDSLALCQVNDIGEIAKEVQDALREASVKFEAKDSEFALITDAITAIDNPDSWWLWGATLEDLLQKIEQAQLDIDISRAADDDFRDYLIDKRKPSMTIRSELILQYLIPTIKEHFIPETHERSELIFETIAWCANHQMLQQALCIFQENISDCLIKLGYFEEIGTPSDFGPEPRKNEIVSKLVTRCLPKQKTRNGAFLRLGETTIKDEDATIKYKSLFKVKRDSETALIIVWCHYIRGVRNSIMHADSVQSVGYYEFACRYLGKH